MPRLTSLIALVSRSMPVLALSLTAALHAGGVRYVDDDAPDGGDGAAWSSAYRLLGDALDEAAGAAGAITEIRVARGRYVPDIVEGEEQPDRDATFRLVNGLTLRGGYAGMNEEEPDARDPQANVTVLSGDVLGDDGRDFANMSDNSYHVVTALNVDETAVLDGFLVSRGRADGPHHGATPESRDQGSAVNVYFAQPRLVGCTFAGNWAQNHGTVNDHGGATLIDCVFLGNYAVNLGAGLYSHEDVATEATSCRFAFNTTPGKGGGAYNNGGGAVSYTACRFEGNTAERGGGLFSDAGGDTLVLDCTFEGNTALDGGGAFSLDSDPVYEGCTFAGNQATNGDGGGAIWNEGGTPLVSGGTFTGNAASKGGAVYNRFGGATITDCDFTGNASARGGGGVWSDAGTVVIARCTFTDNTAAKGGGVYNEASSPYVVDCTFTGNEAINGDGGGGMTNAFASYPVVVDCTFTGNIANNDLFGGGGGMASYASAPTVIRCVFRGNTADLSGGGLYNENGFGGPSATLIACAFHGNRAGDGGGIFNFRSVPAVIDCTLTGNVADGTGMHWGGGIMNHFQSRSVVVNSTIVANTAEIGGGIANLEGTAELVNTIVWSNAGGAIEGAAAEVSYSCIEGGYAGAGNLADDPGFVRLPAAGPDGAWGTADDDEGDLHLAPGSPCIDAGHTAAVPLDAHDLDGDGDRGERLPVDGAGALRFADDPDSDDTGCAAAAPVDIGAYEFQGIAIDPVRPGDVDGDGIVGTGDLIAVIAAWGPCPQACCAADIRADGEVDFGDLLMLLADWGG